MQNPLRILTVLLLASGCLFGLKMRTSVRPKDDHRPVEIAAVPGAVDAFCYLCAKYGIVEKSADVEISGANRSCAASAKMLADSLTRVGLEARAVPADATTLVGASLPTILVRDRSWTVVDRYIGDGIFNVVDSNGIRKAIAEAQLFDGTESLLIEIQRLNEQVARPQSLPLIVGKPALQMSTLLADCGQVNRASRQHRFSFPFVNVGLGNLMILQVNPSCSCVKVNFPKGAILPRSTGEITADYDITNDQGPFSKYLVVQSNDPRFPELKLGIQGYVADELAVSPLDVNFGRVPQSSVAQQDVIMRYYSMRECRITSFESSWPDMQISILPVTDAELQQLLLGGPHNIDTERLHNLFVVQLRIRPGASSQGLQDGFVTLNTNLSGSNGLVKIAIRREITAG